LEHLEQQGRSNRRSDRGVTTEDIVVAEVSRSLVRILCLPPWGRDWPSNNSDNQKSWRLAEQSRILVLPDALFSFLFTLSLYCF